VSKRIGDVELTGELLMQLALELVSDLDVHKCMQRVILNECGRIAELVFEQVKLIPSKFEAV
jgi:hypothetical protein